MVRLYSQMPPRCKDVKSEKLDTLKKSGLNRV